MGKHFGNDTKRGRSFLSCYYLFSSIKEMEKYLAYLPELFMTIKLPSELLILVKLHEVNEELKESKLMTMIKVWMETPS